MIRFVPKIAKRILKRFNRTVCYSSYAVTGCHYPDDLREVVQRPDPVCLDVGAHWGETVREFQHIFDRPHIHAIEPSSANCETLRKNLGALNVYIHQIALGAVDGRLTLNLYPDSVLNSFLPIDCEGPQGSQQTTGTEDVRVTKLDTFLAENRIATLDLLKIDTQGYELAVLQGAGEALSRGSIRAILLEVNFSTIYTGQPSFADLLELLKKHNFTFVDFYQKARIGHALSWCNALFEHTGTPSDHESSSD